MYFYRKIYFNCKTASKYSITALLISQLNKKEALSLDFSSKTSLQMGLFRPGVL